MTSRPANQAELGADRHPGSSPRLDSQQTLAVVSGMQNPNHTGFDVQLANGGRLRFHYSSAIMQWIVTYQGP